MIFIRHRPSELLVLAGLYPLVDLPLQHDRYVIGVMLPEWLWSLWVGLGIMEPEMVLELEGVFARRFLLSN